MRHLWGFLKLWWHFRKDAWNYGGPMGEDVTDQFEFKRPEETLLVFDSDTFRDLSATTGSASPTRVVYR